MKIKPRFDWIAEPRLRRVLSALQDVGDAKLVGGCVRDGLLGFSPLEVDAIDIDIATDRTPDEMKAAFEKAAIRWVATGEAHGTITAIEDGLVAECTSLRADLDTDGRHAEVRFTRDWDEDWRRRDFTINALYADESGEIWDPCGGQQDLADGRVRFIGDAGQRITEDALRILRFFRFSARFAETFDKEGLEAIKSKTELLDILSRERIWSELSRTFAASRAPDAFKLAESTGTLARILPGEPRLGVFRRLHERGRPEAATSVAALWPGLSRDTLKARLKPSSQFLDTYETVEKARSAIAEGMAGYELLYRFGRYPSVEGSRLAMAEGHQVEPALARSLEQDQVPVLPVSGKDLIAKGLQPGPEIGKLIATFEKRWLDAGAPNDPQRTDALLSDVLSGKTPS